MDIEVSPILFTRRPAFTGPAEVTSKWGPEISWQNRPRVEIAAASEATLDAVVEMATERLRLDRIPRAERKYDTKEIDYRSDYLFPSLDSAEVLVEVEAVINSRGAADWNFDEDLRVSDVRAATEAGIFDGDPRRLYFIADSRKAMGGNGGVDYWLEVIQSLEHVNAYVQAVWKESAAYLGFGLLAQQLIKRYGSQWRDTGADLARMRKLFRRPKTTAAAAKLIEVSEPDAISILEFLGFELGRDGKWRTSGAPRKQELQELLDIIDAAAHRSMNPLDKRAALGEILGFPVGERKSIAAEILNRFQKRTITSGQKTGYVLTRDLERSGLLEVSSFRDGYVLLGWLREKSDNTYRVEDDRHRILVDEHGADMRFSNIHDGASYLLGLRDNQDDG